MHRHLPTAPAPGRDDAVFMQHVRDGPGYLRRGIEGGQHGLLHGIHIPFVLRLVFCVLPQQPVQFHGRGKQFEVGLRPVDGIRQFPCSWVCSSVPRNRNNALTRAVRVRWVCAVPCQGGMPSVSPRCCPSAFCLRLNAILFDIEDDGSRQLRVEQVIFGRQGEIVVREVIDGEYVSDKR